MHCAISPTRDKSPFNLLVYKPPTSARNILKIVELGFSQFCLLCALVRLWVELICIRRTKIFQPMMAPYPILFFSISSTRLREPPYLSSRQASTRLNTETPVVKLANDLYLDRLFVKIRLRIYTWTDYPYDGWSVSSINRANEDQWVDFDDSNNSLNAGSFIYGEIIPDLESQ